MKLMTGNSNLPLARDIASYLEIPLTEALVRRFADEEIFVEIMENVRGEDVFLVQSTSYPANDNLMELLIITDALVRASARRITAVIPYFGYARQDRKTGGRTPISAKLVANLITRAGALLSDATMAQWVLFRLDGGIDHILVDESQDTNEQQWRVVRSLAEEFFTGAGAVARHPMHHLGGFFATPHPFLPGDFVTTDAGTGLVHMAPDHGEDDFYLCKAHGIDPNDVPLGEWVERDGRVIRYVAVVRVDGR